MKSVHLMQKILGPFTRISKLLYWGSLVLLCSIMLYLLPKGLKRDRDKQKNTEKSLEIILSMAIEKLHHRWSYGDLEGLLEQGKMNCPGEVVNPEQIDPLYLRCNPNYLQCYFSKLLDEKNGNGIKISYKGDNYIVRPKAVFKRPDGQMRLYTPITRSRMNGDHIPHSGIVMQLQVEGYTKYSQSVILIDHCHESYLPQRMYKSFEYSKKKEGGFYWDNFDQHIFVDNRLVTFRDISEWLHYTEQTLSNWSLDKIMVEKYPFPVWGLTFHEMEKYCNYKGKEMMNALIFDASSVHPEDKKRPVPLYIKNSVYPWTIRDSDSFIMKKYKTLNSNDESPQVKEEECLFVYSKECVKLYPEHILTDEFASWMGMRQIMGGPFEAVRNVINPDRNLNLSSFYFPMDSTFQQLGQRGYWDGKGVTKDHIQIDESDEDWRLVPKDLSLKIGFRCFRYE